MWEDLPFITTTKELDKAMLHGVAFPVPERVRNVPVYLLVTHEGDARAYAPKSLVQNRIHHRRQQGLAIGHLKRFGGGPGVTWAWHGAA